jgi:hypothetical protein
MLFAQNPGGGYYPLREGSPVDSNGIYYFSLVPEGTYLIQAVPADSNGYLPTYFGDVTGWQQATQVILGIPANPYNINLVAVAGPMTPGPGSLTGQISNGQGDRSSVELINMMLMNESGLLIGFSDVDNLGYFNFQALDYGTYFLRAELSGVSSDNMRFDVTYEKPHVDVVLNYSGNSVLDVLEPEKSLGDANLYPNPVSDKLTISLDLTEDSDLDISIYSIVGQLIFQEEVNFRNGENMIVIPFDIYPQGLYSVRITNEDGDRMVRKIIKSN